MIRNSDESNINSLISKSTKLVLLDFWAPWCLPCKTVSKILEDVSEIFEDKLDIFKINVDDNKKITEEYEIRSVPTFILIKNNIIIGRFIGSKSKDKFLELLSKYF